jgi:hypothetical protein
MVMMMTIIIIIIMECERKVMPVIIGETGNISKSLRPYLNNMTGKHEIKERQ